MKLYVKKSQEVWQIGTLVEIQQRDVNSPISEVCGGREGGEGALQQMLSYLGSYTNI